VQCPQVHGKLGAFVDGEVPCPEIEAIEGHLQQCSDCRQAYDRLQRLANLIEGTAVSPVPETLAQVILHEAARQSASPRKPAFPARLQNRWQTLSISMRVAAALLFVVGLSAGAAMGRFVGQTTVARLTMNTPGPEDPVAVYNLKYLGGTQDGSIAQAYLGVVSPGNPSGE
jgi:anti-sigma factor RsiW